MQFPQSRQRPPFTMTLSPKGQLTLPAGIVQRCGFQRGDRFVLSVDAADGFAAVRLPRGLARRKAKP
jgi:bifunctional DNA-binding transcriptional regulator/antitoxin component of YhaV-PrlF toxin-antitoxin module